jgi:alkylhydroperoxidase family enzyme
MFAGAVAAMYVRADDPAPRELPASSLAAGEQDSLCRVPLLDDDEAWARLPPVEDAAGTRLPHWARALAGALPRTTAAMLELDYLYRASDAFDPKLRARMRWVAAEANRCEYTMAYARADLLRAGATPDEVARLSAGAGDLAPRDRAALSFARKMTQAASTVSDEEMQVLVAEFGEPAVVAMVLQLAYANFQDRLLMALGVPLEQEGPLAPLEVLFASPRPDQKPQPAERPALPETPPSEAPAKPVDAEWNALNFTQLQDLMEAQRARQSRITVPLWEDVRGNLEPGSYNPDRQLKIKWSLVVLGNQPRLGTAWLNCLRTFGREANQDHIFEETMFWVITRSLQCFY